MTLISNLKGGQQRYMPLLMSKINDTMPNNAPGFALTSMAGSSHETDLYGESEHARSLPSSTVSSPFGTPPLSALEQTHSHPNFSSFVQGFEQVSPVASPFFPSTMAVTTGMGFTGMSASAPVQLFSDPSVFQFPTMTKYDSDD